MVYRWLIVFLSLFVFSFCTKQQIKQYPTTYDFGYFPLETGVWKNFGVTFIAIDSASNRYDTIEYELREVYSEWMLDAANDSVIKIDRFVRANSAEQWQPLSVWQQGIKGNEAHQVEENIRYLKIKFPVEQNSTWYGDSYNRLDTLEQHRYSIASLDIPDQVNDFSFDSVLTIMQKNDTSLISKLVFFEQYAYGLGLIRKQQIDIYSKVTHDFSIPVEQRITQGTLYFQDLIAYGKN